VADQEKEHYYAEGLPIPETPKPGELPKPWTKTSVVGKAVTRIDAYDRVSGTAVYPSDISLPNMLYGAILRCPHAHARVTSMDTGKARRMPGVQAVIGIDTPEAAVPWTYRSRGIEFQSTLFDPLCRFEGETVAAVAARTPYQAWDAVRAIEITYETLPFVADERTALDPGAAAIHKDGNRVAPPATYERGDVAVGFAEAEVVLEQRYRTECEIHAPMEPHGCVANWDGDRLTLWESTQGVYRVQSNVAETLGLPLSKVRVVGHYMGGGFGSKLSAGKYTIIAALLARRAARPVKMILSREETYLAVGNRPPSNMRLKAGVTKKGRLTAMDFTCTGTGGAYPAGGTSLVDWLVRDLYACSNVRTLCTDVYVNAGPARAFRAPGHPQGAWALEQMMDALAEAIGLDPVAFRLKNIPLYSQARKGQPPYTTTGLRECLEEGARAFGWREARKRIAEQGRNDRIRKGVGVASALWVAGGGRPPATIVLKLFPTGASTSTWGPAISAPAPRRSWPWWCPRSLGCAPNSFRSSMPIRAPLSSRPPAAVARPFPRSRPPSGPPPSMSSGS
jgi:CO/xanthine dehydrogenase Mo-binding subunit